MGARARLGTAGGLRREEGRPLSLPPSEVGDPPPFFLPPFPSFPPYENVDQKNAAASVSVSGVGEKSSGHDC